MHPKNQHQYVLHETDIFHCTRNDVIQIYILLGLNLCFTVLILHLCILSQFVCCGHSSIILAAESLHSYRDNIGYMSTVVSYLISCLSCLHSLVNLLLTRKVSVKGVILLAALSAILPQYC